MTAPCTLEGLARAGRPRLEALVAASSAPDLGSIAGFEWRGWNEPWFTALLGIRKFIKGFFQGPEGLEGYNIPARQNGFREPWQHRPSPDSPHRFGFYVVVPAARSVLDRLYPSALLLDYGASPRNPVWRPERVIRDYLVQPDPGNPDNLLGKAYLALGPCRVASNFFILERLRPSAWAP